MLNPGGFDPVATREARSQSRVGGRQMSSDQLRHLAREWAGLLLDIDHSKTTLPLRLPLQAIPEPSIDDLQTLPRVAGGGIPAIKPIEHMQFVRRSARSGDDVDGGHAPSGMRRENKAIHRERPRRAG